MDIVRLIERRLGRLLGRDVSGRVDTAKDPAAAAVRYCEFGHAVFEGNHLCNYGHRAA
jgi:hypothetical protein